MTFYETNDQRQQIEILRRFSAGVLNDKNSNLYRPYTDAEQIELMLTEFFFGHTGITHVVLYYGCPEIVIVAFDKPYASAVVTQRYHARNSGERGQNSAFP